MTINHSGIHPDNCQCGGVMCAGLESREVVKEQCCPTVSVCADCVAERREKEKDEQR